MAENRVREPVGDVWDWTAHEQAQRRRYANLPLAAKIAWLEEAHRMAIVLEQQRNSSADTQGGDPTGG